MAFGDEADEAVAWKVEYLSPCQICNWIIYPHSPSKLYNSIGGLRKRMIDSLVTTVITFNNKNETKYQT